MWPVCRGDKAVEYSRKLEYLKREEELIKEEELEAEALLQPSGGTFQVLFKHSMVSLSPMATRICVDGFLLKALCMIIGLFSCP